MKRFLFWNRPSGDAEDPPAAEPAGLITGNPAEDHASMAMLLESIAEVTSGRELDDVLDRIVRKSIQVTDAERAIVLLGDSVDGLEIRTARDVAGKDLGEDLQFSRSIIARSLEAKAPMRSVVRSDQEALELGQSVFDLKLRAVMCAPLEVGGRIIGVIYVDSKAQRREFNARDLALFGALSAQIAIAVENARLYRDSLEKVRLQKDMELAQKIQQHLLTEVPAELGGLDCALHFVACDSTSGDTYDIEPWGDRGIVLAIGDATGHGIGAALLTHAFQSALRSYLELLDDISEIAYRLNERLTERSEEGHFLSMILVRIDAAKGELHYVNAGHPSPLLLRGGDVVELDARSMVLGVVSGQRYPVAGPVALQSGDVLFLRTDGVDEAMNAEREMFGGERIRRILAAQHGRSAAEVVGAVVAGLERHVGEAAQDDDVTMIAVRVR